MLDEINLIILDNTTPINKLKNFKNISIIYISNDYHYLTELKNYLEKIKIVSNIILPKEHIQNSEKSLISFNQFISQLPKTPLAQLMNTNPSQYGDEFLYSLPYEKNPYINNIFDCYCLCKFITDQIYLKTNCKVFHYHQNAYIKNIFFKKKLDLGLISHAINFIKSLVYELTKKFYQRKYLSRSKKPLREKIFFLYYPFYDYKNQKIISRYLGSQQEKLETEYSFMGICSGKLKNQICFYQDLSKSQNSNLLFEISEFTNIQNIFTFFIRSIYQFIRVALHRPQPVLLDNFDFSNIIKSQLLTGLSSFHSFFAIQLIDFINIQNDLKDITYLFENFGWERSLCFAINKKHSLAKITAYQHYAFGINHINIMKHYDLPEIYQPHQIGVIGDYFKKQLIKLGWPLHQLSYFQTFRYEYLKTITPVPRENKTAKLDLIILFSISISENIFLCQQLKNFLSTQNLDDHINVFYRTHPALPDQRFKIHLSANWKKSTELTLTDSLKNIDIVLCGAGGAGLEALLMGKTLLIPLSNTSVDLSVVSPTNSKKVLYLTENITLDDLFITTSIKPDISSTDFFY